jgi:enolase-phosphatase E1
LRNEGGVSAVLLDIEGTTTPADFVTKTLFPYARDHVAGFLKSRGEELEAELRGLRDEHGRDRERRLDPPAWQDEPVEARLESAAAYVAWLMDRDRKATPLKTLQGRIWEEGYRSGELVGQVFEDVPRAFERWRSQGKTLAIFSSGSVLAQKLLFAHSTAGDLRRHLSAFFDTATGPKRDPDSYRRIAVILGRPAVEILFVSDTTAELDAARGAGVDTALCVRTTPRSRPARGHRAVASFDEL